SVRGAGPGREPGERRVRGVLPGQVPGFSRPGYGGEHTRQAMNLWRRPGGDRAPLQDHVQQRLVVLAAGPAGEEPRHLIMHSVGAAQRVTPGLVLARSFSGSPAMPASFRRPRWAETRTAPG